MEGARRQRSDRREGGTGSDQHRHYSFVADRRTSSATANFHPESFGVSVAVIRGQLYYMGERTWPNLPAATLYFS